MTVYHQEVRVDHAHQGAFKLDFEWLAYGFLLIFALVLRVAELNDVAMTQIEATRALSAYAVVHPATPAIPNLPDSSFTFWSQVVGFTVLGGSEFASRIGSVLAGMVLILMPLLFRSQLGRDRTFLLSLILATSSIAFASARTADPIIWVLIFGMVSLWAFDRYVRLDEKSLWAGVLAGSIATLIFLTGSAGLLLLLVLGLAVIVAIGWMVLSAPADDASTGEYILAEARSQWQSFPWRNALLMMAIVAFVGGTGFMLRPDGFNAIALAIQSFFSGWLPSATSVPLLGLLSLFVYEPFLLILGVTGMIVTVSQSQVSFQHRLMASWMLVGAVLMALYQGAQPSYALILVLPLAWFTVHLISELLVNYLPSYLGSAIEVSDNPADYAWIKWVVALGTVVLMVMMMVHLQEIGRSLLEFPIGESPSLFLDARFVTFRASLTWFIIAVMFLIVGYFLFASYWGNTNPLQGLGLGVFIVMLVSGIGTGWNMVVYQPEQAIELWHLTRTLPDAEKLRETLLEVASRDTKGFPEIPISILLDADANISANGLVGWLVRDFDQAQFVPSIGDLRRDEIALMPLTTEDPDLGGSYVGQSFAIQQSWSLDRLYWLDWLGWLTQRRYRPQELPQDTTVLWLRIDVYEGIPASERP